MDVVTIDGLNHPMGELRLVIDGLRVARGGAVGVVGPPGAGKSTLLRLIAGLATPGRGAIRVFGLDPAREAVAVRQRITWMSDTMSLFPVTLAQHAVIHARFHPRWDADWFGELVVRFGLRADTPVPSMSKGEGTRARLALALGHRPELVLLDEPGLGLDVPSRRDLWALLEELRGTATLLVAGERLGDVQRIADRVLVLQGGALRADGSPAEVGAGSASLEEIVGTRGRERAPGD